MSRRAAVLVLAIIATMGIAAAAQPVIKVTVLYDHGNVTVGSVTVTEGYLPPVTDDEGDYLLRVQTADGGTSYARRFAIDRRVHIENVTGTILLNQTDVRLTVPYSENASRAVVYRDGREIDSSAVPAYTPPRPANRTGTGGEGGDIPWIPVVIAVVAVVGGILYLSLEPR